MESRFLFAPSTVRAAALFVNAALAFALIFWNSVTLRQWTRAFGSIVLGFTWALVLKFYFAPTILWFLAHLLTAGLADWFNRRALHSYYGALFDGLRALPVGWLISLLCSLQISMLLRGSQQAPVSQEPLATGDYREGKLVVHYQEAPPSMARKLGQEFFLTEIFSPKHAALATLKSTEQGWKIELALPPDFESIPSDMDSKFRELVGDMSSFPTDRPFYLEVRYSNHDVAHIYPGKP